MAGSETTGAAIAITLHQVTAITLPLAPGCDCLAPDNAITMQQISSNPRIEWLVREELRRVLQGRRLPTYQDLDKLVYLKLCIRETLRLYPSAHVFGRKAEEETLLGGYLIPKGSSLLLSPEQGSSHDLLPCVHEIPSPVNIAADATHLPPKINQGTTQ